MLSILNTPFLSLPLLAALGVALCCSLSLRLRTTLVLALLVPILASVIYSLPFTSLLDRWLSTQVPPSSPLAGDEPTPVAVILGRGPLIGHATTALAASALSLGRVSSVYVSGDDPSAAERLLQLGVPPSLLAVDSCARNTWENANLTAAWLRHHHPRAPVLLITDPWQLPRATHAFRGQGLAVIPQPAIPSFSQHLHNRLVLREAAATLLYRLMGRI